MLIRFQILDYSFKLKTK